MRRKRKKEGKREKRGRERKVYKYEQGTEGEREKMMRMKLIEYTYIQDRQTDR